MADILVYGKQEGGRLPAGYKELEYIESSGTQYIDTGAINNNFDTYEINLKYVINQLTGACIHGAGYSGHRQANYYIATSGLQSAYFSTTNVSVRTANINTLYEDKIFCDRINQNCSINNATPVSAPIGTTTYPYYLFNFNKDGTVGTQPFYGKLYSWSLKHNGTLVRNLVPCYRRSDNEVGMFDLVSNTFFTNAGTGSFIAGPEVGLPEGYTELEYIQASGQEYISGGTSTNTYYIDTLFTPSLSTKMEIKTCFDSFNQENLHGASYNGRFAFGGTYTPTAVNWYCGFRNVNADTGFLRDTNVHIFELDANNGTFTVDRTNTYTFTGLSGTTSTGSLYIFGRHLSTGEGANSPVNGKVYYCKIWDNNVLVRNYIPARRDSDNEAGLYDLVNNTFYPNTGTKGSFIAGPVVSGGYLTKEVATEVMIKHSNLLENTVTFKVEDADYQIVSVKSGNAVSKPAEYNYWKDINENVITFPYIPTSDITLYYSSKLPSGYQEVEYIEATGTQWINTNLKPQHEKFKVEIKAKLDSYQGTFGSQIGAGNTSNHLIYNNSLYLGDSTTISNNIFSSSTVGTVIIESDENKNYSLTKYNGSVVTGTYTGTILSNKDYYLLAMNAANFNKGCTGNLYYVKIWDNDILVRNFIPCYRKSDSKPGMYDTVNNVFYTNQGSGDDFTVGPDVN